MAPLRLNQETLIPVGTAMALAVAVFKVWIWLGGELDRIDTLELRVNVIERASTTNRWTCRDHQIYQTEMRALNQTLKVPPMPKVCDP